MLDPLDRVDLRLLVGPTASGKTELALAVAERAGAEVVALDSMLVYRGLDIGTAKPDAAERARVRHHMLDLVEPSERYDVQRFLADVSAALEDVFSRDGRALFVGGTGFYLAAILRGLFQGPPVDHDLRARIEARRAEVGNGALHAELARADPASAERLHPNDAKRVVRALEVFEQTGRTLSDWQREWDGGPSERERRARVVGLDPGDDLDERIRTRARAMLDAGWREEALAVRDGPGFGPTAIQALGYDTVLAWADGEIERDEAAELIALRTRQFARRQRTWYRKFDVHWLPSGAGARNVDAALEHFAW